jgi:hypothetical protein
MVATAGRGPWGPNGRPYVRLLEPLLEAIASDDIRLDTQLAASAVSGLASAASQGCPHGQAAGELLIGIDLLGRLMRRGWSLSPLTGEHWGALDLESYV